MSIIIAICMIFTLAPTVSFAEEAHSHCHCGGNNLVGDHSAHGGNETYQPWNPGETPAFNVRGNYYLTGDVELSSTVLISQTVRICLNGYTLTCKDSVPLDVEVNRYGAFFLCDCKGTGKIKGCINDSVMSSGETEARGGCVHIRRGAFYAFGVEFTGARVRSGGAIYTASNASTVKLYNCKITNNKATKGGAQYSYFAHGGGITMLGGNLGIFGGEITGNIAELHGGAIAAVQSATNINLDNVKITGNTANASGGAIYYSYDSKINLSGDTVITGNKCGDVEHNIYLVIKKTEQPETEQSEPCINADGLTKNAKIGVTLDQGYIKPGEPFSPLNFAEANDTDKVKCFIPDAKNYYINYTEENGKVILNVSDTAACDHTGGTATCKKRAVCEKCGMEYSILADHNFAKMVNNTYLVSEADCVNPAKYYKVCTVCNALGDTYEHGDPLGHDWSDGWVVTTPPTCTTSGTEELICKRDGTHRQARLIDEKGHSEVVDDAKAPTCTETGLTEGKHCSTCNEVLVKQNEVPSLGHKWDEGKVTKEAAPGVKGEKTFTCTVCQATRVDEIPALPTYKKGDVDDNGEVTVADARLALRAAVSLDTLTGNAFLAADVDEDGSINVSDARTILRVAVELESFDNG